MGKSKDGLDEVFSKLYVIALAIGMIIGAIVGVDWLLSRVDFSTQHDPNKTPPTIKVDHWYGEYCSISGKMCEFHDGDGTDCPFQVNDKDPLFSLDLRLKEGSCKIQ